jgi:hypothetical protein
MAQVCKRFSVGSTGKIRESKVEWSNDGPFGLPSPTLRCRDGWNEAYVEFCGPDDIIEQAWGDLQECAKYAAATATLVAIFASPAGALPAFKAAFYGCIEVKSQQASEQVGVALGVEHESGDWGAC